MKKILVIDDEPTVRANVLKLLNAEKFHALGADNGLVGVQMAREYLPDLIVCDIMMPELDGYGVLSKLQQEPTTATIPFIFLTAKADQSDLRQGMDLGADDYLTKPFTRADMLGAIATRLAKKEIITQRYTYEHQRAEELAQKMQELKQFTEAKDELLNNLAQELRHPLSNINMAIHLLKEAPHGAPRDRYLEILQNEFAREITLLNQVAELQRFLTPESVKLLSQFNLLKGRDDGNFGNKIGNS